MTGVGIILSNEQPQHLAHWPASAASAPKQQRRMGSRGTGQAGWLARHTSRSRS